MNTLRRHVVWTDLSFIAVARKLHQKKVEKYAKCRAVKYQIQLTSNKQEDSCPKNLYILQTSQNYRVT